MPKLAPGRKMGRPRGPEVVVTTLHLPTDMHRKLKYAALDHDTTMSALITEFVAKRLKSRRRVAA